MSGAHRGWVGVDLDGTLAQYDGWRHAAHIGAPVPLMQQRVIDWLKEGREVRIFTARIYPINECVRPEDILTFQPVTDRDRDAVLALRAIQAWCLEHFRAVLPVTNLKDYGMTMLYDDRCVTVEQNTGKIIGRPNGN